MFPTVIRITFFTLGTPNRAHTTSGLANMGSTFPYILTVEDTAPGTPIIGATAGDGEINFWLPETATAVTPLATGTCSMASMNYRTATTTEITVSGLTNGLPTFAFSWRPTRRSRLSLGANWAIIPGP